MSTPKDFETPHSPTWCPGCGNYGIWVALKQAVSNLGLSPHELVVSFGIGCSGNMSNFVTGYGFHSLHGRALPVAEGVKVANHRMKAVIVSGDGDSLGEGLGHLTHGMRGNWDVTYLMHNNQVYGLTTGQTSPTSLKGYKSKSTPTGVIEIPVNPLSIAISHGAGFVARGFAGDAKHLTELVEKAMIHKGFSFIDVLQPCVTFNKLNTYQWFMQRVHKLEEEEGYQPNDRVEALKKTLEDWNEKIPIGIFYQEEKPTYEDNLPQLADKPLVEKRVTSPVDISPSFDAFR